MRTNTSDRMLYGGCGCVVAALIALALCISLPIVGNDYYQSEYCWFPPSGPNVEVVVSACDNPSLRSLSPDGKYMIYVTYQSESWLRNLETGEVRPTLAGSHWLNNNLVLGGAVWGGVGEQQAKFAIWDVTDDSITPIQWVQGIEGATTRLEDGSQMFSSEVVQWFQNAEQVYYIKQKKWAIALGADFKNHSETNYILASRTSGQYWKPESILDFLADNYISYTEIDRTIINGSARESSDGRFIVRSDGFFTADGQKIGPYIEAGPAVYGWAYDDSGVYAQHIRSGEMWVIPKAQPILKINLPLEYMSPEAQATETMRQLQLTQQKQARQRQDAIMFGGVIVALLMLLGGGWFFWRRRKIKGTQPQA